VHLEWVVLQVTVANAFNTIFHKVISKKFKQQMANWPSFPQLFKPFMPHNSPYSLIIISFWETSQLSIIPLTCDKMIF